MEKIERQVAREVKAMGRREVTTNAIGRTACNGLTRPLPLLPAMREHSRREQRTNVGVTRCWSVRSDAGMDLASSPAQ
jgi:hypothetical protein